MKEEEVKKSKSEDSRFEKLKSKIKKVAVEGILAASLILTPTNSYSYYNSEIYLPPKLNINRLIETTFKEDQIEFAKELWKYKGRDIKELYMKIFEVDIDEMINELEKEEDRAKFYLRASIIMKTAELYTLFDILKREEILLKVKEMINKELEKEPNNIDLIELKRINLEILYDTYSDSGYYHWGEYESIKLESRKEISKLYSKWKKTLEEIQELHSYLGNLDKKSIKEMPTIFNYSKGEKVEKIKQMKRKLDWKNIFLEMDKKKLKNY